VQLVQDKGFATGGFNFDAKLRRQSVDPADLYLAHIGGIDTIARALLAAADVVKGKLEASSRSATRAGAASWARRSPRRIQSGQPGRPGDRAGLQSAPRSGRQELAESIIARHSKY
jgi:xylose isomerase